MRRTARHRGPGIRSGRPAIRHFPPPTGACCALSGSCSVTTHASCQSPSTWTPLTTCSPNTCPVKGACCDFQNVCNIKLQADCAPGFIWHPGVSCTPNICTTTGACCAPDGTCEVKSEANCPSPGIWHPQWTSCNPNNCPPPTGACCALSGNCSVTTHARLPEPEHVDAVDDLQPEHLSGEGSVLRLSERLQHQAPGGLRPGVHLGHPGVSCTPNLRLTTGACCAPDGTCEVKSEANCPSPGIWHPEWATCSPNNCPPPLGSCCNLNGDCSVTAHVNCPIPSLGT